MALRPANMGRRAERRYTRRHETGPNDMPAIFAELLADTARREAVVQASQALLRERFTQAVWRSKMLALLDRLK